MDTSDIDRSITNVVNNLKQIQRELQHDGVIITQNDNLLEDIENYNKNAVENDEPLKLVYSLFNNILYINGKKYMYSNRSCFNVVVYLPILTTENYISYINTNFKLRDFETLGAIIV